MEQILQQVLDKLQITWELDEDEERNFKRMIEDGQAYLEHKVGAPLDFSFGMPRSLLLERIRYEYNGKLEFFENNFFNELDTFVTLTAAEDHYERTKEDGDNQSQ